MQYVCASRLMPLVWPSDAGEKLNEDEQMHPPQALWEVIDACREFLEDVTSTLRIGEH